MNAYDGLIFEQSVPGRVGYSLPEADVPEADPARLLPAAHLRRRPAALPEVSEFDAVRHYTRLSRMNYGVDTHFYPLGSCTMKYNPKINEDMARLPGFARLHPLTPEDAAQGALQLMGELGEILAEIVGMDAVSLQPAAGAQGELTGVLMIRAFHLDREGSPRKKVLVPDSAHGTNPASTAIAGYQTVQIKSDANGEVDLLDLERHLDEDVAALMITVPNTLGLFESRILEATGLCHAKGAQVYMDGANLNALLGLTRPGDLGFDVVHMNLHKTFTTPHGGGGPGAGPVAFKSHLAPFMPAPVVARDAERVAAGLEAAEVHRQGAVVLGQLRDARPGLHVHPHDGAGRAPGRLGERDPERQLHPGPAPAALRPALRGRLDARGRLLRSPPEGAGHLGHGHRQAAARSRLLRALDLLPADRRGGDDDRAHRDGVQGDARPVLRRDDPDRAGGRVEPGHPPRGAGDDAGAAPRPDAGRPAAEPPVDAAGARSLSAAAARRPDALPGSPAGA